MITELFINGQQVDLDKADTIAFTKSVFDINKPSTRTSEFSNAFKVPKTQNNRLIFKSAGLVNSFNDEPYDKLEASVRVDGLEVVYGIAELMSSEEDYYVINVQGGNGSFYKSIKALSLVDISQPLSLLNHEYNAIEVSKRRDLINYEEGILDGLIYPNVDYGYFDKTDLEPQNHNYFFPALYLHYIINNSIDILGYKRVGAFWQSDAYRSLAIMAKNIVSDANVYFIDYNISSGFDFFATRGKIEQGQTYTTFSALNFPQENDDENNLYIDTDLGLGYTTFGYNFPINFNDNTTFVIGLNGTVTIQDVRTIFTNDFVTSAKLKVRLQLWNKVTDTYITDAASFEQDFFSIDYEDVDRGQFDEIVPDPSSEEWNPIIQIAQVVNQPNGFDGIASTATDHALVWFIEIETTTLENQDVQTPDLTRYIDAQLEFDLTQSTGGSPTEVSVINTFDDVNIGNIFLYVCNVLGVFPKVDEALKTIDMFSFDDLKKNKGNALDWSKKIDISQEPEISFKLDYAQQSSFEDTNDDKDVFLNQLTNYGKGTFVVDNENLPFEVVKYQSPFSLCAIAPTFNNTRSMGKIYTGDKFTFDGQRYNRDPEAEVDGFSTRIVNLARSTQGLVQIQDGIPSVANYEVNNTPILFSRLSAIASKGCVVSTFAIF